MCCATLCSSLTTRPLLSARQDEATSYLRNNKGIEQPSQQQIQEAVTHLRAKRQQQQQAQQQQQQQQGQQQTPNAPPTNRTNPPISAHPQHPPPITIPTNTAAVPPQPAGAPLPAPLIQSTLKAALDQSIRMSWKDLPQHLHLFQPESEGKSLQVGLMKGAMGLGRLSGSRAAAPPAAATVATAAAVVAVNGNSGASLERKESGGMEVSERMRNLLGGDKAAKGSKKKDKDKDKDKDREKKREKKSKEDKKRKTNDLSPPPTPTAAAAAAAASDSQQAAKRPKLANNASSVSLASAASAQSAAPLPAPPPPPPLPAGPNVAELVASHDAWKRSTEALLGQVQVARLEKADTLEEMRRRKEETERAMREREEDEVKIRTMRRTVEEERRRFEEEKRARKAQENEEDALMAAVWREEEWYLDMNVMRRKVTQLVLQRYDALRVDEERVVELIALGCQQYVKGVVEEMVRVKSARREEEKERWRHEGRAVEGVDGLEEVKRRERERAVLVDKRLKERERLRRKLLAADGAMDEDEMAVDADDEKASALDAPPPPPRASARLKADDANKLTVADLVFVMERDGRLRRSERMWTVYGRLGLRMKDWPPEWQPPAQSVQSTYTDVSAYNAANVLDSSPVPPAAQPLLLSPTFTESAAGALGADALLSPFTPAAPSPHSGAVDGELPMQDEGSSQRSLSQSQPSRQSSSASLASASSSSLQAASPFPATSPSTQYASSAQPAPSTPLFELQLNSQPSTSTSAMSPLDEQPSSPTVPSSEAAAPAESVQASNTTADSATAAAASAATDASGTGGDGGAVADDDFEAELMRQFNE